MQPRQTRAFPVFLAFLAMGFADAAGPLVSQAKEYFHISNFAAQFVTFSGLLMFGILSVPASVFQDRKGKKTALLLGLAIMFAGIASPAIRFLPALNYTFPLFLLTMLLLGAGATILQVAGNPIMRDVSATGKYSRNLSLGQFVKAIGSLSGTLIPVVAVRYFGADREAIFAIFPIYSVVLLIALVACLSLRVNEQRAPEHTSATFGSSLAMLGNGYVAMMILALFLYVGAEVSVSSGIPLYLKERFQVDLTSMGLLGTMFFFLWLTIGRFLGSVILTWMKPRTFFLITCLLSLVGLLAIFLPSRAAAWTGFCLIGLGFANIFPLIFSIVIDKMPEHSNALSGLMVMAIVGGAVVPLARGLAADSFSQQVSFIVPLLCLVYIAWTACMNLRAARA